MRAVPISDVNFNENPCRLSLKLLDKYYFILLEKESVVLFHKHWLFTW